MLPSPRPATLAIIIVNAIAFGLEQQNVARAITQFALWPLTSDRVFADSQFAIWQLITYSLLHQPDFYLHIVVNMTGLYVFGSLVERVMKAKGFIFYYASCAVGAALTQLAVMYFAPSRAAPVVGASGAVFGVLCAFAMYFPRLEVVIVPTLISVPSRVLVAVYAAIDLSLGIFGSTQGVAHFAHLGGMATGVVIVGFGLRNRRQPPDGKRRFGRPESQ